MNLFKNLFTKKSDENIYAPVNGYCFDIVKSSDKTFAGKMIGDGFGIVPLSESVCAPCSGTITMIFPSNHAFGIKMNDGTEILVHIGINTVELAGKCFTRLKEENITIRAGEPVIKFDYKKASELGYDVNVYTIVVNNKEVVKTNLNKDVTIDDIIIERNNENN